MLKKSFTTGLLVILAMLVIKPQVQAQNAGAEVEKFVKDFANAYDNVTKTKDTNSVLKFVSKDLHSTIINSNVIDDFGLLTTRYQDFEAYITRITETPGYEVDYKITKILRTIARGRTGVVICEVDVTQKLNGELLSKGTEATTFTMKKFKNGWKILHFTVVSIEEELNKGTCMAELFAAATGDYMAKTVVPSGQKYDTKLDNFEFRSGKGLSYISVGDDVYSWVREGDVKKISADGGTSTTLGSAIDEEQAIMVILSNDLYKEQCTGFQRKR